MNLAYSAKIQPSRFGWKVEIVFWPAGAPAWIKTVEASYWALTHRGAIRKAQRILRRRRARANRKLSATDVTE